MNLLKYTIRRLLWTIPIIFGVLTLTFFLSRFMPGNPFEKPGLWIKGNPEHTRRLLEYYGLDKPLLTQFLIYVKNMFRGDWGESLAIAIGIPAWDLIMEKFPITLELGVYTILLSSIIGIRTGVFTATHRNKPSDTLIRTLSIVGVSIPVFWMGIILQYFLALRLNLFPVMGLKSPGNASPMTITSFRLIDCLITGQFNLFIDTAWHLILPVSCQTFIQIAGITRLSRSSMLEVLEMDYIRTARAKGCKEKYIMKKHALKNAIIPTVTMIGMRFGMVLGGAIMTEATFNLSGLGMFFVEAVTKRDYFIINGCVFLITLTFTVAVVVVDILYAVIDPRIKY